MSHIKRSNPRVVALLGDDVQHRNTLATLIANGINIVGVFIVNEKVRGVPFKYVLKSAKKRGWMKTSSQILARVLCLCRNYRRDKQHKSHIFDDNKNKQTIKQLDAPIVRGRSYSLQIDFISELKPEILLLHTGSWVGKDVREIESVKYVIGGHPGITPMYRGSRSPFWAIYNRDSKNIGWTCFIVDKGLDAGPVIEQGYITSSDEDNYMSLSWKGMVEIALSQVRAVKSYYENGGIFSFPHHSIPQNSEYSLPTLRQQIWFWIFQRHVK